MRIYIESYGCTLNHGEARYLLSLLLEAGHERSTEPAQADVLVIFTCTVIRTTELKMLRQVRKFSDLDKPVIVSGCMAVVQRDEVNKINPKIHFLLPKEISKINQLLDEISHNIKPLKAEHTVVEDDTRVRMTATGSIDSIIPIATGCRGRCTYCVTRLARGDLTSYSEDTILQMARAALASGHYELRLTAQDSACYGLDSNGNLAILLAKVAELNSENEYRIRVGMMNPDSVRPFVNSLIESYKHTRVFKFLHLPVQSGDDGMIDTMGRMYTAQDFLEIIKHFREAFPKLSVSTDIIVGYPGETETQFSHSLELIKDLRPNIVNITRFSARPGTSAAELRNTLPGSVVKARSRALTELRFGISKALNNAEIGNEYRVLVAEQVQPGSVLARTDNYQPVVLKAEQRLGAWLDVRISGATDSYLLGEVVG